MVVNGQHIMEDTYLKHMDRLTLGYGNSYKLLIYGGHIDIDVDDDVDGR